MRPHILVAVVAGLLAGPVAGIGNPGNFWLKAAVHQYQTTATTATTATATASSAAPTHTVAVGATGFTFTPNSVSANIGDIIEFNFYPGNHSVVRSAFKFPCIPYEDTGPNRVGFFSGFLNTNVYSSDGPKWRVRVNDSEPIFYYCDAPGSCVDNHMIGVINPNATWTLDLQDDYTSNTTIQVSPGEPLPSEMAASPSSAAPGATASASSTSSTSSTSGGHHHGLSGGAIAGIVIGALAAVGLACGLFFFFCCYGRRGAAGGGGGGGDGDAGSRPAYPGRRRRRDHYYNRNSWLPRGRAPDGMYGGGGGGGTGGNVAMLAPVSPTTASGGMATPPSFLHRPFHNGSPAPPVSPEMADMGGFAAASHNNNNNSSSGMVGAAYPTYSTYNTAMGTLPLYPGQHPGALSPLQSHPPYTGPGSPDKEIQHPPPTLQTPPPPPPQVPVELPAARVAGTGSSNALRAPPPAALKESPTMGAADSAWAADGTGDGHGSSLDLSKDLSKGEK